ncbi:unnamed protein product, partial [Larinioides sclopetarius]
MPLVGKIGPVSSKPVLCLNVGTHTCTRHCNGQKRFDQQCPSLFNQTFSLQQRPLLTWKQGFVPFIVVACIKYFKS